MAVDIDHLADGDVSLADAAAAADAAPMTVLRFLSPSGDGVKVLAWVDPAPVDNATCYRAWAALAAEYARITGCPVDKSGKDCSRLTFICHDPDAYLAPAPEPFLWQDWEAQNADLAADAAAEPLLPDGGGDAPVAASAPRRGRPRPDADPAEVLAALRAIPVPQEYRDWFRLVCAGKHSGLDLADVEAWSGGGAKYVAGEVADVWEVYPR